jgi:hypothetical protein
LSLTDAISGNHRKSVKERTSRLGIEGDSSFFQETLDAPGTRTAPLRRHLILRGIALIMEVVFPQLSTGLAASATVPCTPLRVDVRKEEENPTHRGRG